MQRSQYKREGSSSRLTQTWPHLNSSLTLTVTEYRYLDALIGQGAIRVKVEFLIGLNISTNHLLKPVSYPLLGHFCHNFKILFFVGDRGGTFLISRVSDSYQHQHDLTRIYHGPGESAL